MTVMTTDAPRPRRWDAVVRITHWSIVAAVLVNAVFAEEGSSTHVWVGYALAAILAARLIWGVIGPAEARFSAFPPSPRAATQVRLTISVMVPVPRMPFEGLPIMLKLWTDWFG